MKFPAAQQGQRPRRGWGPDPTGRAPGSRRKPVPYAVALLCIAACGDVPVHHEIPPAGVATGTVVYQGPLPCTKAGHVVGAIVLLAFYENQLPPPDGFASSAQSLSAVAGDTLFAAIEHDLPAHADGSLACPPSPGPSITVSASWSMGPLDAGRYQIRAFYDYVGNFSPLLGIHNLPTANDIVGGALLNPAQSAQGAEPPRFQTIVMGEETPQGKLQMPPTGARVDGVTVTLGRVLSSARPVFFWQGVLDERPGQSAPQRNPTSVSIAADERFAIAPSLHPDKADAAFLRLVLAAGVPPQESDAARNTPLFLQTSNAFLLSAKRNAQGAIASIPEATIPAIAELFPEAVFTRLDPRDRSNLTSLHNPAVILNGLVVHDSLPSTLVSNPLWQQGPLGSSVLSVYLRPSVVCFRPSEPASDVVLVTPSFHAQNGELMINPDTLGPPIAERLGRPANRVHVVEGCLPTGKYAANLIYDTGQAWTVPNEAGQCVSPLETPVHSGPMGIASSCKQIGLPARPALASQTPVLTVSPSQDPAYCETVQHHGQGAIARAGGVPCACFADFELPSECKNVHSYLRNSHRTRPQESPRSHRSPLARGAWYPGI